MVQGSLSNHLVASAVMVEMIEFENKFFLLFSVSCSYCRSELCVKQPTPSGLKKIFTSSRFHTGDHSAPSPPPQLTLQPCFVFVLGRWISPSAILALSASVLSVLLCSEHGVGSSEQDFSGGDLGGGKSFSGAGVGVELGGIRAWGCSRDGGEGGGEALPAIHSLQRSGLEEVE